MLPDDLALFELLTIWEHLEMSGAIHGLSHREIATRGEQMLNFLDLWKDRHAFVDQSSYGMKKKCALAMALIHNPKVLLLDEPFEGIDPVSSRNIKDLLVLMAGKGVTVFITSHILEIVERLVHSFAIIVNGELACSQTMDETLRSGRTLEEETQRYETMLGAVFLVWLFPVLGESHRGVSSRALLHRENYGALWKIALLTVVYVTLYYVSVTWVGRRFEERRETVRAALT